MIDATENKLKGLQRIKRKREKKKKVVTKSSKGQVDQIMIKG